MEVVRLNGEEEQGLYDQLVETHVEAIHEGFLSTLGPKFLNTLYRILASGDKSFLLIARDEQRVLGFICGSEDTSSVYRDFMKRAGASAVLLMLPKMVSPARIKRVVETLLYPNRQKEHGLPEPEILNFCVRSQSQGKGVGSALFNELLDEFGRRQIDRIRIVTGESQKSAQLFYEAKGSRLVANIEVHKGVASRVYVHEVPALTENNAALE